MPSFPRSFFVCYPKKGNKTYDTMNYFILFQYIKRPDTTQRKSRAIVFLAFCTCQWSGSGTFVSADPVLSVPSPLTTQLRPMDSSSTELLSRSPVFRALSSGSPNAAGCCWFGWFGKCIFELLKLKGYYQYGTSQTRIKHEPIFQYILQISLKST